MTPCKFAVAGRVIIHAPYPEILIPRLAEAEAEAAYRLRSSGDRPGPGSEQP